MATIKQRVAAGARYLDKTIPGWAQHINLAKLEKHGMADNDHCILGQLGRLAEKGDAHEYAEFLGLERAGDNGENYYEQTEAMGFIIDDDEEAQIAAWRAEVEKRISVKTPTKKRASAKSIKKPVKRAAKKPLSKKVSRKK